MKIQIKAKDFLDKEKLEKELDKKLKKPLAALMEGKVEVLPFCYEVDYFEDGKGFVSIGETKEVYKLFKTKRVKGQGTDEDGKPMKIDKKKVAYGTVSMTEDNELQFYVMGGIMKPLEAKKVIRSIGILKKKIGDRFQIVKGLVEEQEEDGMEESTQEDGIDPKLMARQIIKYCKSFIATEWSELQNNKAPRTIINAYKKGRALLEKLNAWYNENVDNTELDIEIAAIKSYIDKFNPLIQKIKALADKLRLDTDGDDEPVKLESIAIDIENKVGELLSKFKDEIDAVDGLRAALESISK